MPYCSSCGRLLTGEGRFCAACGAPQEVESPPPAQHLPSVPAGRAPPPAAGVRRPFPGWAVALLVVLTVSVISSLALFVLPFLIVGSVFSAMEQVLPADAHIAGVRTGVRDIQTGIESWRAADSRGSCPPEAAVTPAGLGRYVDPWPRNPYTGGLMQPGGSPGDYVYRRLPGGDGYTLTGYGGDGAPLLTVP